MADKSEILRDTLAKPDLHQEWVRTYIADSKKLYDLVFDEIKETIWQSGENNILDAGCGNGINSLRLFERGFKVTASDFSEEALKLCKDYLTNNGVVNEVELFKQDILSLTFENNSFQNVLCWGVLMHIHEVENALDQLCRIITPGGTLVICEVSKNAFDSIIVRIFKKIFHKKSDEKVENRLGIDYWTNTNAGRILVRKTNIKALIDHMNSKGFVLVKHIPGQFSQLYTKINIHFIKKAILLFNLFWFKYLRIVFLSLEQVLIFKRVK